MNDLSFDFMYGGYYNNDEEYSILDKEDIEDSSFGFYIFQVDENGNKIDMG
jgi:hypothetical protein